MPFQKGNKLGGRKSVKEELEEYKETVKKQTIEELATDKVFQHLKTIKPKNDRQGVKDIAMPVYLKSKADKTEHKETIIIKFDDAFNSTSETEGDSSGQS